MSKKPLSKKEIKARKAEQNKNKRKKIDYRQFANKFFKKPTDHLPLIIGGIGLGTKSYCYNCQSIVSKTKTIEKVTTCGRCGSTFIEMREKNPSRWKKIYWKWKEFRYLNIKIRNDYQNNWINRKQ